MSKTIAQIGKKVRETGVQVAWAQWSALTSAAAMPGSRRPAAIVDPEALVLLSLAFRDSESRLTDLVFGMARTGTRLLSVQRMGALADTFPARAQEGLREFAWTAAEAGDRRWSPHAQPPAEGGQPVRPKSPGALRVMSAPGLVLRLRAGLGVGIKADLLAVLMGLHGAGVPLKVLALATGYSQRGLRNAAEEMAIAGFVQQNVESPVTFAADHRAWAAVLNLNEVHRPAGRASVPSWRYWSLVFAFLAEVEQWSRAAGEEEWSEYVASSRARDLAQDHAPRLRLAGILLPDPRLATGTAYLDDFAAAIDRAGTWCGKNL